MARKSRLHKPGRGIDGGRPHKDTLVHERYYPKPNALDVPISRPSSPSSRTVLALPGDFGFSGGYKPGFQTYEPDDDEPYVGWKPEPPDPLEGIVKLRFKDPIEVQVANAQEELRRLKNEVSKTKSELKKYEGRQRSDIKAKKAEKKRLREHIESGGFFPQGQNISAFHVSAKAKPSANVGSDMDEIIPTNDPHEAVELFFQRNRKALEKVNYVKNGHKQQAYFVELRPVELVQTKSPRELFGDKRGAYTFEEMKRR